jgi:hypothetical protein
MRKETIDMSQPIFQPIKQAVKTTGLSEWFLRQALKNGTFPHNRTVQVLVMFPIARRVENNQP